MRRLVVVLHGMNINIARRVENTKKRHLNVPNRVKWDKTSQKLLVTNELCSVIGSAERILCDFGAEMVGNGRKLD